MRQQKQLISYNELYPESRVILYRTLERTIFYFGISYINIPLKYKLGVPVGSHCGC